MTGSSSKLLQIEGKWYRERKAKKIQNLRQKKIPKLFYTHLINLRLFSVFAVWCVHVASLYDSTLRFLVAARPDSAPWLSTTNPWDDSWGSSLEGFSLAQSNLKQSGRSALQLKSYHGKYFTVLEACHGFSPCHSSVKSLVTVEKAAGSKTRFVACLYRTPWARFNAPRPGHGDVVDSDSKECARTRISGRKVEVLKDARGCSRSAGSASAVVHAGNRSIFEMQEVQQDDKGQTRKNSQKRDKW